MAEQREPAAEKKRKASMLTATASSVVTHDDVGYDSTHGDAEKHGTHDQAAYGDATQDAANSDA